MSTAPTAPEAAAAAAEPAVVEPLIVEPIIVEPIVVESVASEPASFEPVASEAASSEPASSEPAASEMFAAFDDEPVTDQIAVVAVAAETAVALASAAATTSPESNPAASGRSGPTSTASGRSASPLNEAPEFETVASMTFDRKPDVAQPRPAASAIASPGKRKVLPSRRRRSASTHPKTRKRSIVNTIVMIATAGLVATVALPAYAYSDLNSLSNSNLSASSEMGIQSLTVAGGSSIQDAPRDGYTSTGDVTAMDSTTGTTVSPTVQALAAELMGDVAAGKLVGSVPNHLPEIQNLANGVVVPNCGVDYRVLQAIKLAVDNFGKVGVSDINRLCTGQIEGAGTQSPHYLEGGGHAVDFYILNGHGLTGADADSLKFIQLLDAVVPQGSGIGQEECRGSIPLKNLVPFDDTCTHDHVDFLNAKGAALTSD